MREYPPKELTDDERNAVAGRFVMNPVPLPDPPGRGEGKPMPEGVYSTPASGRDPAAPHGYVYIRREEFEETTGTSPEEAEEQTEHAEHVHVAVEEPEAVEGPTGTPVETDVPVEELAEAEVADEEAGEEAEEEADEEADEEAEEEYEELPPVESMTVHQLRTELDEWGAEAPAGALKADLQALLTEARASEG